MCIWPRLKIVNDVRSICTVLILTSSISLINFVVLYFDYVGCRVVQRRNIRANYRLSMSRI